MATELKRPAVLSAVFKIRTDRSEEIIKTSRCIGNRNKSMRKFAFERKIGAVGKHDPRIFTQMPKGIVSSTSLEKGSHITITFYDQHGKKLFDTEVNLSTQNRIYLPNQISKRFIEHYGYGKVPFEIFEEEEKKWVAQELC